MPGQIDVTQLANAKTEEEVDAAAAQLNAAIGANAGQAPGGTYPGGAYPGVPYQPPYNPYGPPMLRRVQLIDVIRGICVLCMVCFHCFFVLGSQFEVAWGTNLYAFFKPAQPAFAAIFILIAGICARFSRDVRKRGFLLIGIAAGITAATVLLLPYLGFQDMRVWFGVIHLLAVSTLLFGLLKRLFDVIPSFVGLILCLFLFFLFAPVGQGYLGMFGIHIDLPAGLYQNNALAFLGFCTPEFEAFDHFPLLPYMFIFLFGTFVGKMIRNPYPKRWGSGRRSGWDDEGLPEFCYNRSFMPFFGFLGRQALPVYLLHVPVFYGLVYIVRALLSIGS